MSALMQQLPGIFRASKPLRELLGVLEEILLGPSRGDDAIARRIAVLPDLLDPAASPEAFLPWLARLVALPDISDFPVPLQRDLIARSVPLHVRRGSKPHLIELLRRCSPPGTRIEIDDHLRGFEVGAVRVGWTSQLQHDPPFFEVMVRAPDPGGKDESRSEQKRAHRDRAERLIEWSKPAHTSFRLDWDFAGPTGPSGGAPSAKRGSG